MNYPSKFYTNSNRDLKSEEEPKKKTFKEYVEWVERYTNFKMKEKCNVCGEVMIFLCSRTIPYKNLSDIQISENKYIEINYYNCLCGSEYSKGILKEIVNYE